METIGVNIKNNLSLQIIQKKILVEPYKTYDLLYMKLNKAFTVYIYLF